MRTVVPTMLLILALFPTEGVGAGAGDVTVTMRTAASAVHPKDDLLVVVAFRNGGDYPFTLGEAMFSIETIEVMDQEGRVQERDQEVEDVQAEAVTIGARETHEWTVNLSRWYPRLTRKRGEVTVRWSAGALTSDPLEVAIIKQYEPKKDRRAIVQTDEGTMVWRFLPEIAPAHVKNFVDRARQGRYDGLTIFKAIPGYKIVGGDPKGDGTGAWENLMMPELNDKVFPIAGMVGASRRETSMTSDSMFFLLLAPTALMQGKQTFFAVLEDGWETVSFILARPRKGDTKMSDAFMLHEPVRIQSVTIK